MSMYSKTEVAEAHAQLRTWVKPGDTVYTILNHVSRSGMCRHIRVQLIKCTDEKPVILQPNHAVACVLGYRQAKRGGLVVRGCGMDMGFHIIHSLGYALFGQEAEHGLNPDADTLRQKIYEANTHYWHQYREDKNPPDFSKPNKQWFGAAGYALHHQWL